MFGIPRAFTPQRSAFTLVEVMISVALVLVLIIGVNQVFKITADTVGAGQVMSENIRDTRAAQSVIFDDVGAAVMNNPPAFIIASSRVSAFRNPADRQADRGGVLSIDLDNDNNEGETIVAGELISPATYNFRSHRTDRLAFFARGLFQRQTGDDGTFASSTGSSEAYIWYGHLNFPNNSGDFKGPGTSTFADNQNNFDASAFALGRRVILMRDPTDPNFPAEFHYNRQFPIPDPSSPTPVPYNPNLTPFAYNSRSNDSRQAEGTIGRIQNSRYDLAGITIAQFFLDVKERSLGSTRLGTPLVANAQWWQVFVYTPPNTAITTDPYPPERDYRFEAERLFAKPLDSEKAAKLAPILLDGCSQFIVEYAGDYLTQDDDPTSATYGDKATGATGNTPDGTIDFVVDNSTGMVVRRTRWYGMPRDVSGAANGGPNGIVIPGNDANPSIDVVPLRDVRGVASPFERAVNQELKALSNPTDNYLGFSGTTPNMDPNARYTCVWGPDVDQNLHPLPRMLRITFVLDDAFGRLAEGQTYEYVITLPR